MMKTPGSDMKLRILLSYWYFRNEDMDALMETYFPTNRPDIFADSGAFSAMTQGGEVNLVEYAAWLKRWKHLFKVYANLDVIMDAQTTWNNQQYLEDLGLAPLPCFHVREDWKWLEKYLDSYEYVALGIAGMHARKREVRAWLTRCFQLAQGRARYHGFAMTTWDIMRDFPWGSVDSSSWAAGFRYGRVPVFSPEEGKFYHARLGEQADWQGLEKLLHWYGFDILAFVDREKNTRRDIILLSALSYMQAEIWLRKRWASTIETYKCDNYIEHFTIANEIYLCDPTSSLTDIRQVAKRLNYE